MLASRWHHHVNGVYATFTAMVLSHPSHRKHNSPSLFSPRPSHESCNELVVQGTPLVLVEAGGLGVEPGPLLRAEEHPSFCAIVELKVMTLFFA